MASKSIGAFGSSKTLTFGTPGKEALATPCIGDFDVVFAGGGPSITVQQQEKTR